MWHTGEGVWASKPSSKGPPRDPAARFKLKASSASSSHESPDTTRRPGRPPRGSVAWGPAGAYGRGWLFRGHRRSRGPGGWAGPDGARGVGRLWGAGGGGRSPGPGWRAAPAVEQGVGEPQGRLGRPAPAEEDGGSASGLLGVRPQLAQGTPRLQGTRPQGASATATQRGGGRVRPGPPGSAGVSPAGGAQRPVGKYVALRLAWGSSPTEGPGQGGQAVRGRSPEPTGPGVWDDGAPPPWVTGSPAPAPARGPSSSTGGRSPQRQGLCPPQTLLLGRPGTLTSARRGAWPCGRRPRPPHRAPAPPAARAAARAAAGSGTLQAHEQGSTAGRPGGRRDSPCLGRLGGAPVRAPPAAERLAEGPRH